MTARNGGGELEQIVYSPDRAAEAFGGLLGSRWLVEKAREGLIPHVRIARSIGFTRAQIVQIIAAHTQQPAAKAEPVAAPEAPPVDLSDVVSLTPRSRAALARRAR